MARRTFLRNPMSVDVGDHSDYEETLGYFNFSQFNGINSNKNYVSIDQASFEKAENVYVDQDGQLHTRPPLKEYNILPASYHVVQIFKINNLTIYHVLINTRYELVWIYNGDLIETTNNWVYDKVKIINKRGLYVVFTQNSATGEVDLKAFELRDDAWEFYTAKDIIYVPETQVINLGINEDAENYNLLTGSFYSTFIFNSEYSISVSSLENKLVTITIQDNGGEEYVFETIFHLGTEKVLVKKINSAKIDADIVEAKRVPDSNIMVYLMYRHNDTHCYLSINGSEFYTIDYPSDTAKCPVLSDDASQLYILDATISGSFDNGENNTESSLSLYYINIQTDTESVRISSWAEMIFEDDKLLVNMAYTRAPDITQYSCQYELYRLYHTDTSYAGNAYAFGHSPEAGKCVYMVPARVHINVYTSSTSTGFSVNGTRFDAYADVYYCILYTGGVVHTYFLMNGLPQKMRTDDYANTDLLYHYTTYKGLANRVRLIPTDNGHPLLMLWNPRMVGTTLDVWIGKDNPYGYYGSYFFLNDNGGVYELMPAAIEYIEWGTRILQDPTLYPTNAPNMIIVAWYAMSLDGSQHTVDFQITDEDLSYYQVDVPSATFSQSEEKYICNTLLLQKYWRNSLTQLVFDYVKSTKQYPHEGSAADYTLQYTYESWTTTDVSTINTSRAHNRFSATRDIDEEIELQEEGTRNLGYHRFFSTARYLCDTSLVDNSNIAYLRPSGNTQNIYPVYIDEDYIVYYDKGNQTLYSSAGLSDVTIRYLTSGDDKFFMPDIVQDFITIVLTKNNVLYWTTDVLNTITRGGKEYQIPALYIEQIDNTKGNWQNLPDDITELTVFSQTSLGVFLENNVYEFQYNVDNDVYLLTPTKLQLGNRKGSEVLANYDGQSIFITNIKGLISLTYEDFVQSTEQVYNYLTENIMSEYDKFATAPIKLYQYKDWLFMYKENETELYVYDTRNKSWWYWTNPYGIKQIVFDGNQVIVLTEDYLLYYDFETTDFRDLTDTIIPWKIVSQKIHFGAPNNYKHIRQLAVITTQNTENMRYKLGFINYHNLFNLVDTDTVEYEINQLTTMIKRVTFMKTNAFQFIIKSDSTDKNPKYFATPNIAIKYRITERVR